MMNWRRMTTDDYNEVLVKWWKDWGWECIPLNYLPKGYIINKDGVDIYAGFIYYTGTPLAWLEYIVSNKQATLEQKRGGLEELVNITSIIAKDNGVASLFVSTNMTMANGLKKNGFQITDKNCVQLIKNL